MVRSYKPKGNKPITYSQEDLERAILDVQEGMSFRAASAKYGIPKSTIQIRFVGKVQNPGQRGHPLALLHGEEEAIAQNLAVLGDFGLAFDVQELCIFIQYHLNTLNRQVAAFTDNLPGTEWARAFLRRHSNILTNRFCQNISRKRAAVSEADITTYFGNLQNSLAGVPPSNIINYDETNLTDDPQSKLMIFRKGTKHAERIMNTTKTSTSIMFACSATGDVLAPYVVYKAERLQDMWLIGGPLNAKYNRTISGWFDATIFIDWIKQVVVPYVKKLPKEEPKILIGDNLPSHISLAVVSLCEENNIKMVFLPPNSTHLLQPLDVGVFSPLKKVWRKLLTEWKLGAGKTFTTLPKWIFPQLLLNLMQQMADKWEPLGLSAFQACGIVPFNPERVLSKVRRSDPEQFPFKEHVSPNLIVYLKETREGSVQHRQRKRGRRVNVPPGCSISLADMQAASTSSASADPTPHASADPTPHASKKRATKPKTKRSLQFSSSDDEDVSVSACESDEEFNVPNLIYFDYNELIVNQYVLVRYGVGKMPHHFVAQLKENLANKEWKVNYFRRVQDSTSRCPTSCVGFKEPPNTDIGVVNEEKVVMLLKVKEVYKATVFINNSNFDKYLVR